MSRPLRDTRTARKLFAGRAVVAGVLVFLLFSVIAARMAWLQIANHEHFATLSDQNRIRLVPVPPTRGQIFDRKGVLLAGNLASFHLEITPEQVGSHAQMEALLEQLKTLIELSDSEINRFRRLLRRSPRYNGVPLRFNLTEDEMARVAINQFRLPGVDIRNDLTRTYPLGTHMAHVVGYVGRIDEQELARLDPAEYSGSSHIGKIGVEKSSGTKLISVSGNVQRPGNYEVELGTSSREIIYGLAGGPPEGHEVKLWFPGGSSSPVLTKDDLDLSYDFDTMAKAGSMLGSGAIIVVDDTNSVVDVCLKLAQFYRHESCGKCTPCREGTNWTVKMLERVQSGEATPMDLDIMASVQENIIGHCLCVLGDAMAMPVGSMIAKFRDEFEEHIERARETNPELAVTAPPAVAPQVAA